MAAHPASERRTSRSAGLSVLVVAPTWMGDSVMAGPAVVALKTSRLATRLTILARPSLVPLWTGFPGVDEVIPYEKGGLFGGLSGIRKALRLLEGRRFGAAVLFPPSFSSALLVFLAGIPVRVGTPTDGRGFLLTHRVENPAPRSRHAVWEYLDLVHRGLGIPIPTQPVALVAVSSRTAKAGLKAMLRAEGVAPGRGIIALGPGATFGLAKRWPLEYWRELMTTLLRSGRETLAVVGGPEECRYLKPLTQGWGTEDCARVRLLAGKTPPDVLAELFRASKLFVTNDTGPMHLAAAVGTPVVAIFGSTSPAWTRPLGKGHVVLQHPVPCNPCYRRECEIGYICFREVKPSGVSEACQALLKKRPKIQPEKYGS